jgi:hypothetical protein
MQTISMTSYENDFLMSGRRWWRVGGCGARRVGPCVSTRFAGEGFFSIRVELNGYPISNEHNFAGGKLNRLNIEYRIAGQDVAAPD